MEQTCLLCGETKPPQDFYVREGGRLRRECKPCWRAQVAANKVRRLAGLPAPAGRVALPRKEYIEQRCAPRLAQARAHLGGQCMVCGTAESLEFDHIDRATKVLSVTTLAAGRFDLFWTEVQKCQLLCREHHIEKSKREVADWHVQPRHGSARRYRAPHRCRCDACVAWAREADRRTAQRRATRAGRQYSPRAAHRS